MKLTIKRRLVICFEVLFARSGHAHQAQEKQLSTFINGYRAGVIDGKLEIGDRGKALPFAADDKVIVYERYLFAIPLPGIVVRLSESNDGVEVRLLKSNNPRYPIGSTIWAHEAQLRPDA